MIYSGLQYRFMTQAWEWEQHAMAYEPESLVSNPKEFNTLKPRQQYRYVAGDHFKFIENIYLINRLPVSMEMSIPNHTSDMYVCTSLLL